MAKRFRRRQNLIRPRFQLLVGGLFVASLVLAVVLFGFLMYSGVTTMLGDLVDQDTLRVHLWDLILRKGFVTLGFCAVLTMAVAIVVTFRIAGPIFRMGKFLEQIRDGENPEPCRLRKGDAFRDFCDLLNEVTEPLRTADGEAGTTDVQPGTHKRERESARSSRS